VYSVNKPVTENLSRQFADELRSFFMIVLLNLVFGAMAMAFGMQFVVTSVVSFAQAGSTGAFVLVQFFVGIIAVMMGIRWILSTARILKGVTSLRREYRRLEKPAQDETLTGMIIRMLAHYRDNRQTLQRMVLICTMGGCVFLALGFINLIQGISAGPTTTLVLYFSAAAINTALGIWGLLSSTWFRSYTAVWNQRLDKASLSENTLMHALEGE
jgi:hypothetical protein